MAEQDLNAIAFPILSETQLARLELFADAAPKKIPAGAALFRARDRDPKLYVIRSGEIEIVDVTGEEPKTLRVQGPGNFTGDVGDLSGSPKIVSAIARSGSVKPVASAVDEGAMAVQFVHEYLKTR